MREFKWAMGMILSLCIFLVLFFVRGARNFSEVVERVSYFKSTLAANPNFLWIALGTGIFVGVIFLIIKTFGERKDDSFPAWLGRSVVLLFILLSIVYVVIKVLEYFASRKD